MARGLRHAAQHGFTSLVNMDGNRYTLEILSELRRQGRLTARVRVPFHYRNTRKPADLAEASAMSADWNDDWLSSGFVKLFMDGVVDSGTAVMINDYPDTPGWRGEPLHSAEAFAACAIEADRRGLQIAVHAIGDGAVRRVLDGYAAARAANGVRDSRHRIEHIELIDRADIPRLAELGVVASIQPVHAPGAMDFPVMPTMNKIPADRWRDAYLCRTLAESGAHIALASDWPVTDINPFRGIQAALTRPVYDGADDQRIGLMDILAGYTTGGAFAEHTEDRKGMLKPGYLADLVILSGDIETTPVHQIGAMHAARMTLCGGRSRLGGRMSTEIEIRGLAKVFGQGATAFRALSDIDLSIASGEFFTLLGPSGCGKTTLLRLIAGFEQPTSGSLTINGQEVAGKGPNQRPVNTVFQNYALFPHMSVAQNIGFGLKMLGKPRAEVDSSVAEMLRLVRMEAMADRKPSEISGGQQQRVALARALAPQPRGAAAG